MRQFFGSNPSRTEMIHNSSRKHVLSKSGKEKQGRNEKDILRCISILENIDLTADKHHSKIEVKAVESKFKSMAKNEEPNICPEEKGASQQMEGTLCGEAEGPDQLLMHPFEEHLPEPTRDLVKSLTFYQRFLLEFYGVLKTFTCPGCENPETELRCRFTDPEIQELSSLPLNQFENRVVVLCNAKGIKASNHYLADYVDGSQGPVCWSLTLSFPNKKGMETRKPFPARKKTSSVLLRRFGYDRFVKVNLKLSGSRQRQVDFCYQLYRHGLWIGWRLYQFVGAKDGSAYFFAVRSAAEELLDFIPLSTEAVRSWLGEFSICSTPGKTLARISLGFSHTCAGICLEPEQIELIDDIFSPTGCCMTDGSGFISADLADSLPIRVVQGVQTSGPTCDRKSASLKRPCVFQVRLFCHLGGFKGTLLINPNIHNKVQLRRSSMKKFDASLRYTCQTTRSSLPAPPEYYLRPGHDLPESCCNPDEKNMLDIVNTGNIPRKAFAKLNAQLIFILHRLGVPATFFKLLVESEAQTVASIFDERDVAIELLLRKDGASPIHDEQTEDSVVLEMLRSGHSLQEPYVWSRLQSVQKSLMGDLHHLKIPCHQCVYLMGQPDPCGLLEEGEVFVAHGLQESCSEACDEQCRCGFFEGKVAITRFPLLHKEGVQVLEAVFYQELRQYLQDRTGVVFFSTKGTRHAADEMAGGDYDGDLFLVCFNEAITIHLNKTPALRDQTRFWHNSYPQPENRRKVSELQLFEAYWKDLQNYVKGISANLWLVWTDVRGPDCKQSRALAQIHFASLDGLKHGTDSKIQKHLEVKEYPHFMQNSNKPSYVSKSIVGQIYDIIRSYPIMPALPAFQLDIDLKTDHANQYFLESQNLINSLKARISSIMDETQYLVQEYRTSMRYKRIECVLSTFGAEYGLTRYQNDPQKIVTMQDFLNDCITEDMKDQNIRNVELSSSLYEVMYSEMVSDISSKSFPACKKSNIPGKYSILLSFLWKYSGHYLNHIKLLHRSAGKDVVLESIERRIDLS